MSCGRPAPANDTERAGCVIPFYRVKTFTPNRDYYDAFAPNYERERHRGYHALIDRLEVDLALRFAHDKEVLEAGCGTGMILKEVAPHARAAVGIDLSPGMLHEAAHRGLQVAQASITQLPFADESFDLVYSYKVLAHIERIDVALSEMARVTRRGGHMLAEFYNPWSLRYLVKRLKPPSRIADGAHDEHVYTRYDSLSRIRTLLPPTIEIVDLRGVRVVTPISHVHKIPLLGRAFELAEWHAADLPFLRRFGGFLIVVGRKL